MFDPLLLAGCPSHQNTPELVYFAPKKFLTAMGRKRKFYAVAKGRSTGVYNTWNECKQETQYFSGARYKAFPSEREAREFVATGSVGSVSVVKREPARKRIKRASPASSSREWNTRRSSRGSSGLAIPCPPVKEMDDGDVHVYVDGSCFGQGSGRRRHAGVGVYFGEGDIRNVSRPVRSEEGTFTNNRAELLAILDALRSFSSEGSEAGTKGARLAVTIHSDSDYGIKGITRVNRRKKNTDLFDKIDREFVKVDRMGKYSIELRKVRAHAGIIGNEKADELAKNGARMQVRFNSFTCLSKTEPPKKVIVLRQPTPDSTADAISRFKDEGEEERADKVKQMLSEMGMIDQLLPDEIE